MDQIPLQHSWTDHPCCSCVSVCQMDKWPVRVSLMYWLPPSACRSLCLFTRSLLYVRLFLCFFSPLCFPFYSYFSLSLCLSSVSLPSFALPLISPPSESSNRSVHGIRAFQIVGRSQFGFHCTLTLLFGLSLFISVLTLVPQCCLTFFNPASHSPYLAQTSLPS